MNLEKIAKIFGWALVILMFVAPYVIGTQSQNAWPGILAFAGIAAAWTGTVIYMVCDELGGYLIPALLSLGALGLAIWLSRMAGSWWWTVVWLIVALAHYATAVDAWQEEDRHMRVALALGLLSTAAAFLLPGLVAPVLQGKGGITISSTFWMWLLLALALVALGVAWYQGYRESEEKRFVWWGLIGVGLLAGATWLSRLTGGWWWSLPWVLAALVLGHAARDLRQYSFGRAAGNFGLALALLCLLVAVGAPALLPGYLETGEWKGPQLTVPAFSVPVQINARSGWQSLGGFLLSALRSVWGIFHLFTLFCLGYLWLRRGWGGGFVLLALLLAIWLAGAMGSSVDETLTHIFSTGPAAWMKEMLLFSAGRWGNLAWGIFLTAFLTSVALVPVIRLVSKFSRVWSIHTGSELTQSTMRLMTWALRRMDVRPLDTTLATYVFLVVPFGLWIALWVALRQVASSGNVPLGFAYIPDLTIPHWKPVWSLRYYSLGLILWLAMTAFQYLQKKRDPSSLLNLGCASDSFLFIGALLTVSLAPAGVTLFSIATVLSQILLFPARVIGIPTVPIPPFPPTKPVALEPIVIPTEPVVPEPIVIPTEPVSKEPIVIPIEPVSQKPIPKSLAGSPVWSSPAPVVAMLEWRGARWFLREDGDIVRQTDDTRRFTLPIARGQALFALKEEDNQLLVVGNGNQVLWLDGPSLQVVRDVILSQPADAAALNPYKTMLAWVNAASGTAGILLLAPGTEVVLLSGLDLTPALAFSADGRYLAVGGADGAIHLVDIATRKVAGTLSLPETSPSRGQAVRALFGRTGGGWVSVYADRRIVLWSADRQIEKEMRPVRRILALDFHAGTGRLALGLSDGILQVFNSGLGKIFDEPVQEKDITGVYFSQDGEQVFTIGEGTEIRRVHL